MNTAELSIEEAQKETASFGKTTYKMLKVFKEILEEPKLKKQKKLFKKMEKYEEITDQFDDEISKYLNKVADGSLSSQTSGRVVSLLSIVNDLESIGDIFYQMSKDVEVRQSNIKGFNKKQKSNIDQMIALVEKAISVMNTNLKLPYKSITLAEALSIENEIDSLRNKLRRDLFLQMNETTYDIRSGSMYKDIFLSLEKVGDHVINVTEAITGESERDLKKKEN
jgi:phosphate:Na+ symporter